MGQKNSKQKWSFNTPLVIVLSSILFIALLVGVVVSINTDNILDKKIAEAEEAQRPASIDIVIITESSCEDCFDVLPFVEAVKKENVDVKSEETLEITDKRAMDLVAQFNITKVPSFLVIGEIEKHSSLKSLLERFGDKKDNTFVFRRVGTPYVLTSSGDIRGRVELTLVTDASCTECYNVDQHIRILQQFGLISPKQKRVDIKSAEGNKLRERYNIQFVPTIILSGDLDAYPSLVGIWKQVGTVEEDGSYVFRDGVEKMGTYKDLSTNKIVKAKKDKDR